jgi:hypothetical protein
MKIVAQFSQKGKLFQHNICLTQNILQFLKHPTVQGATGAPSLLGIRKINHSSAFTWEHIQDRADLREQAAGFRRKP